MEPTETTTYLLSGFFFDWGQVQEQLTKRVDAGKHVILYGPPRQGKSTLVKHVLRDHKKIVLYASEDFGFVDISRNILLALGCSVTTERKKKLKASAKAEVKFAWPFIAGASADAGGESEQTLRTFTAEIGNPNDVCHLLNQFNNNPVIVIEGFDQIPRRDRRLLLDFLKVTSENRAISAILVASSVENPLEYRERLETARYLDVIDLPLMTEKTVNNFVESACRHLGVQCDERVAKIAYLRFKGGLEGTLEVCGHFASQKQLPKPSLVATLAVEDEFAAKLSVEFQRRSRERLFALLWSFIEAEWAIECYRQADASDDQEVADDTDDDRETSHSKGLLEDSVYSKFNLEMLSKPTFDNFLSNYLSRSVRNINEDEKIIYKNIFENIQTLGKNILSMKTNDSNIRFLAFAATAFLQNGGRPDYMEAHEDEILKLNVGMMIARMLHEAPPDQDIILNRSSLEEFLADNSLLLRPKRRHGRKDRQHTQTQAVIDQTSKRLLRRQRLLRFDPPVFEVVKGQGIILWNTTDAHRYGDIKKEVANIVEEAEYLYGIEPIERS